MGNGSSTRRNGRIQQNPGSSPPPRMIAPPPGYPGSHPGPPPYPPSGNHLPYYYPPNYNGPMTAPQFYPQGYAPSNGQYMMSLPPQPFRPIAPHPATTPSQHHVPPLGEAQKANTIRNDINLKKSTLRLERDEENPGFHLVAFTFDATAPGSLSIFLLASEGENCSFTPMKPHLYKAIRVPFNEGLGQKFRQAPGTGVNLSLFDEKDLAKEGVKIKVKDGTEEVYPLVVRTETLPKDPPSTASARVELPVGAPLPNWVHSQTTHAVIERKDDSAYKVRVLKQTIWIDGMRYELQEIYGIENSGGSGAFDGSDSGKECVICMSEPRDTTVLPCRHMCMCSECAKVLRFQTNRCPICRCVVERLLEIKVPKVDTSDAEGNPRSSATRGAGGSQSLRSESGSQSYKTEPGQVGIKVP